MKISLNWLSNYLDVAPIRANLKDVVEKLAMRGLEVESVEDLSKGFEKVIVAQIEARDRHPNADRLSVCKVNTGKDVLQIVCGAQNMKAGDKVCLSQIGAVLPNNLKIEKGKIRDVESFGMLCSASELGLEKESEGILILPPDTAIGKPVAEVLGRNDILLEINVTPNRGDALSYVGVARELASILGQKMKFPTFALPESPQKTEDKIKVKLHQAPDGSESCYQYHARYIEGVQIKPSPEWLQKYLTAIGLRPINNIVDVTNFVLMELGTPLHAFDYSKITGGEIHVRHARAGESLELLDKTKITLSPEDLVIADAQRPVALAGVMGGGNSEVTPATTSILLEAAQFAPSVIRRTARRYQKHTDASHRFERQIDAKQVAFAMDRASSLFVELAGGKCFKSPVSVITKTGEQKLYEKEIEIRPDVANKFLGLNLTQEQMEGCLRTASLSVGARGNTLKVKVPTFRPDIEISEDLYEEILRIWGYDKVPSVVPKLNFIPDPTNASEIRLRQIEKLKLAFAELGFSECVNFGFTSKIQNEFWDTHTNERAISLKNPLNEDLSQMRTSLLSGLFEAFLRARHHQQSNIRLFEVRPVYRKSKNIELPFEEEWFVSALLSGRSYSDSLSARDRLTDFFDAKGALETIIESLGVRGLRFLGPDQKNPAWDQYGPRLHPAQFATVALGKGPSGFVGRLHPKIEAEHKIKEPVYLFEFSLDRALELVKLDRKFSPIAKFPKVLRDFSLIVPQDMPAERVVQTIQKLGKPLVESISIVDTYVGEKVAAGHRSISFALILGDPNRTLGEEEVDLVSQKILSGLDSQLNVKLRLL